MPDGASDGCCCGRDSHETPRKDSDVASNGCCCGRDSHETSRAGLGAYPSNGFLSSLALASRKNIIFARNKALSFSWQNPSPIRLSIYTSQGVSLLNEFFLRFAGSDINNMVTLELTVLFDGAILVFNPSTKEMITLPERPDQNCDICIGFGHTASTEEIKVVRFFARPVDGGDADEEDCFCEDFILGTSDGWREAKSPPYRPSPNAHLPLPYGAFHFLPSLRYHDHVLDDHYITAFNLHTEHYTKVSLPDIYFRDAKFINQQTDLAELRGSLCLIFDLLFVRDCCNFGC